MNCSTCLVVTLSSWFRCGCTAVSAGIGAAIPKTEYKLVAEEGTHAERGDTVQLQMEDGAKLRGVVGTSDATNVEISTSHGKLSVPIERIQTMSVFIKKRVKTNHLADGAMLGCGFDLAIPIVALFAYGLSHAQFSLVSYGR